MQYSFMKNYEKSMRKKLFRKVSEINSSFGRYYCGAFTVVKNVSLRNA